MLRTIDVIIPVYNAIDDLAECINSIARANNQTTYNVIIINDQSPDYRVSEYLANLLEQNMPNFSVYENETNCGFVSTVNRGMSLSTNDVVLLNSDTIVTDNWIDKLVECAYSSNRVGTVTPLTNNGTICSIPDFCQDNELPKGHTIDSFAKLVDKTSLREYPVLPTAVGFCMYIKRDLIEEIGLFDEVNFPRGYGEENDFCCRAVDNGYLNVMCDDTYIYHKGSMSFKEDKAKLIEANSRVLREKHPNYFETVEQFVRKNPLRNIHENIRLQLKLHSSNRPGLLFILHNDIQIDMNHPRGGTEFHVKDLVDNLVDYNCYTLVSNGYKLSLKAFLEEEQINFEFPLKEPIMAPTYKSEEYNKILSMIIEVLNITAIHVHHLRNHPIEITQMVKEQYGIPMFITLHDFYCICPTVNLLDEKDKYCAGNGDNCTLCLKKRVNLGTNILDKWRAAFRRELQNYSLIIVPDETPLNIIRHFYDIKSVRVIEHGVDVNEIDRSVNVGTVSENKFRVAFIGGLAPYKGSETAYHLISKNKDREIEWHLFGNCGDQRLALLERKDFLNHDRYERGEISRLLKSNHINLVLILSKWPETYCYTLTEAWLAGVPTLSIDIGAIGKRSFETGNGWLVRIDDKVEDVLDQINRIKTNVDMYSEKLNNVRNFHFKSIEQMIVDYRLVFREFQKANLMEYRNFAYSQFYDAYVAGSYLELSPDKQARALYMELEQVKSELQMVYNTFGWKLLNRLRKLNPKILSISKVVLRKMAEKYYKR